MKNMFNFLSWFNMKSQNFLVMLNFQETLDKLLNFLKVSSKNIKKTISHKCLLMGIIHLVYDMAIYINNFRDINQLKFQL